MSKEIKPNILEQSEFADHEEWEQEEIQRRDEFHGDRGAIARRANTASYMLQDIHRRNKQRIKERGVGYSKDAKTRIG